MSGQQSPQRSLADALAGERNVAKLDLDPDIQPVPRQGDMLQWNGANWKLIPVPIEWKTGETDLPGDAGDPARSDEEADTLCLIAHEGVIVNDWTWKVSSGTFTPTGIQEDLNIPLGTVDFKSFFWQRIGDTVHCHYHVEFDAEAEFNYCQFFCNLPFPCANGPTGITDSYGAIGVNTMRSVSRDAEVDQNNEPGQVSMWRSADGALIYSYFWQGYSGEDPGPYAQEMSGCFTYEAMTYFQF